MQENQTEKRRQGTCVGDCCEDSDVPPSLHLFFQITVLTFISWLGSRHLASVARNSTSGTCLEGSKRLSSPKRFLLANRGQYIKIQSISTLTITLIDKGLNLKKNSPLMKETSRDSTVLPSPMISQIWCSPLYKYRQNKRKRSRKELSSCEGLKFNFRNASDLCRLIGTAGLHWNGQARWKSDEIPQKLFYCYHLSYLFKPDIITTSLPV